MVDWIINDLSLGAQYGSTEDFLSDLEGLLVERRRLEASGHSISCARNVRYREVAETTNFLEAVHEIPVREHRYLALAWLTKGPFWTPPPEATGIVYFHCGDVTDQGLGEATRRRWLGDDARTFSFRGLPAFEVPSLDVECLRDGAETGETMAVPNVWELRSFVDEEPKIPQIGWIGMVDDACARFESLQIARDQIVREMSKYPFDRGARGRLLEVLRCLNDLAVARATYGDGSPQVTAWLQTYTANARAVFSSEEPMNKDVFRFYDPATGQRIYCPWHGKVHNPLQYRVHFEWPMPPNQRQLKVLFIGEKLTK